MAEESYSFIDDILSASILIVGQNKSNVAKIQSLLHENGFKHVSFTDDPFSVAAIFEAEVLDLIILDIKMSGMDGYGVMESLREVAADHDRPDNIPPVLVLTTVEHVEHRRRAIIGGASDYINFPFDRVEFIARVKNLLKVWQAQKITTNRKEILEQKVQERTRLLSVAHDELRESQLEVVWRLGRAAEYRDNETGLHIIRMSKIAALLAQASGAPHDEVELILNASPMHDIGKLGIPDNILLKPGKLDAEEWEIMQTHAQIGADILSGSSSPVLNLAHDIALSHHEKWDGTGYPNGLTGVEIPFAARVSTVADVFDALTSVRPYKKAWSVDDTMEYFSEQSGKQFDPDQVRILERELPAVLKIKQEFSEPEELGADLAG